MSFDYADFLREDLPAAAARPAGGPPEFNFIGGNMDPEEIPVADLIAAMHTVLEREGPGLAFYNTGTGPLGYRPLREFVAATLHKKAAMDVSPDDILITSGSLQALDLINRLLLKEGDTILIEGATYGGMLDRLNALGVNYVGLELDDGGICMDGLEAALKKLAEDGVTPRYIYTIPTVQNPTGTVMPTDRRERMLELADEYGVPIFEDDCYADLVWSGERPPAIYALDQAAGRRRVLYCGSFSKSIAPAIRIGYIVADWAALGHLVSMKNDGGTSALSQMILAEFCQAKFHDHVATSTASLKEKHDVMLEAIAAEFGTTAEVAPAEGGIFLWITLPDAVDTQALFAASSAEGVALNPGPEWTAEGPANKSRMRLCFGSASKNEIRAGVAKLAEICHREFGVPVRSSNVERS
ncbi:MAG TPA: aminotransferase [Rhodospirillaceae bacterium]|nr:aminotransferase [Rhodospirillaceae bacterium]HAT35597.1 aminotransferase [Rhodospirillaceae bacterium]